MTTASNNSVQGRKQRKYRYTAPNHRRRKMVFVHIGKALRAKLGTARRSIQAHKGDKVEGVVIKFNKHGALASIEEGIAGLVHISEFGSEEVLHRNLELGHRYPFVISLFEPKDMRMALSFAGEKK